MSYLNGTRVRLKIAGRWVFGIVVETVEPQTLPSATADRIYFTSGEWAVIGTRARSPRPTLLVRIEECNGVPPLYRVPLRMLELAEEVH